MILHTGNGCVEDGAIIPSRPAGVHCYPGSPGAKCTTFSAYRLHADDPLIFKDGFTETVSYTMHKQSVAAIDRTFCRRNCLWLQWRNGDPSGCVMKTDGDGGLRDESLGTAGLNASSLTLLYEW